MFRLVLILATAGALWWGYGLVAPTPGAAPEDVVARDLMGARAVESESAAGSMTANSPPPSGRQQQPLQRKAPLAPAVEQLLERIRADDPAALAGGYGALGRVDEPARTRVASELEAALARAPSGVLAVRALGRNNQFLHCPEGRAAAAAVIHRAASESPETALRTLTAALEVAMRGDVQPEHQDARATLDALYTALRRPLMRSLLNPANLSRARTYTIQSGDTLGAIAGTFRKSGLNVESGTLQVFNRIDDPRRIQVGQVIKVPIDPVHTVVQKRSFTMALYCGDVIFRMYRIGHGVDDRTPEVMFTVGVKKEHPDWYAAGKLIPYGHPDNVLGDYFVKFRHPSLTGFGAHGTSQPETIGTMASAGCLRMADADIEEFFRIVPRGSEVEIRADQ